MSFEFRRKLQLFTVLGPHYTPTKYSKCSYVSLNRIKAIQTFSTTLMSFMLTSNIRVTYSDTKLIRNTPMVKRAYELGKRAETAKQNDAAIHAACVGLWHDIPLADITLEKVAELAKVSVRTILRKFGSKDGLLKACIEQEAARIMAARDEAKPSNQEQAINILLHHYDAEGDAILRALSAETSLSLAQDIVSAGREYHRNWCARLFKPALPEPSTASYELELAAYIATTDIYMWKLLRRDQKLDHAQCKAVMLRMINALNLSSPTTTKG